MLRILTVIYVIVQFKNKQIINSFWHWGQKWWCKMSAMKHGSYICTCSNVDRGMPKKSELKIIQVQVLPLQNDTMNLMFGNANCKAISDHANYIKKGHKTIYNGHIHMPTIPKKCSKCCKYSMALFRTPLSSIDSFLKLEIYDATVFPKPNM